MASDGNPTFANAITAAELKPLPADHPGRGHTDSLSSASSGIDIALSACEQSFTWTQPRALSVSSREKTVSPSLFVVARHHPPASRIAHRRHAGIRRSPSSARRRCVAKHGARHEFRLTAGRPRAVPALVTSASITCCRGQHRRRRDALSRWRLPGYRIHPPGTVMRHHLGPAGRQGGCAARGEISFWRRGSSAFHCAALSSPAGSKAGTDSSVAPRTQTPHAEERIIRSPEPTASSGRGESELDTSPRKSASVREAADQYRPLRASAHCLDGDVAARPCKGIRRGRPRVLAGRHVDHPWKRLGRG